MNLHGLWKMFGRSYWQARCTSKDEARQAWGSSFEATNLASTSSTGADCIIATAQCHSSPSMSPPTPTTTPPAMAPKLRGHVAFDMHTYVGHGCLRYASKGVARYCWDHARQSFGYIRDKPLGRTLVISWENFRSAVMDSTNGLYGLGGSFQRFACLSLVCPPSIRQHQIQFCKATRAISDG